jgi:hypothetical protein
VEEQREAGGAAVVFGNHDFGLRALAEQGRIQHRGVADHLIEQLFVFGQVADETEDQGHIGTRCGTQRRRHRQLHRADTKYRVTLRRRLPEFRS